MYSAKKVEKMSEAVTTPPVEQTPPADVTPPEPSTLPSEQPAPTDFAGFDLTDDVKAKFKDGKLNGRFGSIDEVLSKLKEAEDFKANTIRDQTNGQQQQQEQQTQQQTQQATVNELVPMFMQNGMVLTPEMEAKATEAKIDIRDLKIGAMELREATTKAFAVVGGEENYKAMLTWGKSAMSVEQQASFDKAVTGSMSEYAIKGLNADYQKALSDGHNPERIQGSTTIKGLSPYGSRKELYADKSVAENAKARGDINPWNDYQSKLRITPNEILGIR